MNNTNMMNNTEMMNNMPVKKSKMPIVIVCLLIVIIAAVAIYFLVIKEDKETNPNSNNQSASNQQSVVESEWNGVYENNGNTMKLYQVSASKLFIIVELNDSYYSGTASISGNTATYDSSMFGETSSFTFTLNGSEIQFTESSEEEGFSIYTKKQDYTKEDYYEDMIGDPSYLQSKYNGYFKKDNTTIILYQVTEDQVEVSIQQGFSFYGTSIPITNGSLISEEEFFDELKKINITVTDNSLTITASSTEEDSILNTIDGTYEKEKDYTIDDVLDSIGY